MTRTMVATLLIATTLVLAGACGPQEGSPNEGTGGRASAGTTGTGGGLTGTGGGPAGTGGGSGGDAAMGGQTTVGTGGTPEQSGGQSGTGGSATGGHSSGGAGGAVVTGTGGAAGAESGGTAGALGTGGAGGTVAYAPCPTDGSPCKILPFGDSITEGVASSDGAGYRTQLFKLIVAAKQKVTFVGSLSKGPTTISGVTFPRSHEGHSGWRIGGSGSGGLGVYSLIPSPALNDKPHMILLLIGANDVFSEGTEGMATRLDALLEKVAQAAPTALIVLAQMTPIGTSNNGHTAAQVAAANAAQAAYNSKIPGIVQAHVAKGQHIIVVDMSKMPLSDLTTSSMHPNDKGYAYMAGIWYPAIKDLLPK